MINKKNALKAHIYVGNYYILDVEYIGKDIITYRAEDMKYDREVWLHEYFPDSIAKRYNNSDEKFTVYVHPTKSELFHVGEIEFQNLYNNLKMVNHPSIPAVYELFESSGTLFVSTKYSANRRTLRHHLKNSAKMFLEHQIGMLALSIVRAFILLQQHKLQICLLNPETLLIDNITQKPIVAYSEYTSFDEQAIRSSIYELGVLLYEIIDNENFETNKSLEPLKPNKVYSAALCGLVDRMISDDESKHFKTFQELQTLLQNHESTLLQCEPIGCERVEGKFSSYVRLASIILIVIFIYNVVTQTHVDAKNLTWFDSMRYHLVAHYGNVKGQSALGQMYEKGYYVDADIKESIVWYKKAAKQGDVDAQLSLAHIYKNVNSVKDDKVALKIFLELAREGNLYAQKTLGYSYMNGDGTPQDYKKAMYWFQKVQEHGDSSSCVAIGWMYESGNGVEKDLPKAIDWLKKALDRNNTYSKEEFVKLEKKIKKLAELSLHDKKIQEYRLGYQYEKGSKRNKNHKRALEHYMASAKLGSVNAEFRLAQLYERSEQIPRDYSSALYWYKQAAEHGDALAYYRVSQLYRAGLGVKKDSKLALQWCKEAAERGLGVAQGMMGACYELGWGTHISYTKARYWYELAIENGFENSVEGLKKLNKKLQRENERAHASTVESVQVNISTEQLVQEQKRKVLKANNSNTSSVNVRACLSCHGKNFEYRALGKSAVVANMTSHQIATALKGYKSGRYGGAMKALMRGQVARYSDADLEAFAKTIGR